MLQATENTDNMKVSERHLWVVTSVREMRWVGNSLPAPHSREKGIHL